MYYNTSASLVKQKVCWDWNGKGADIVDWMKKETRGLYGALRRAV